MKPSPHTNPYLAARREWNERYGEYIAQARTWRVTALLALLVAAVSTSGLVWIASSSGIVPYVVKVDKLGAAVAVSRADEAAFPDKAVIVASLARWVANMRSVYADAAAERAILKEGYAMINRRSPAYQAMNAHMRAHDPFERAKTETVTLEVETVLPLGGDNASWRIEWREETRSRDGADTTVKPMQATVTLAFLPPSDEATIRLNPMGIYVNSFDWAQRL
jgi:type IV secretion system protein VirB5